MSNWWLIIIEAESGSRQGDFPQELQKILTQEYIG